jgi:hypothetical protein
MSRHLVILTLLPTLLLAPHSVSVADSAPKSGRIKKCQDAKGEWHYGDSADEACARSKVIEIDKSGVQRKVIAAPKTQAELKAMEQQKQTEEDAKKQAAEQAKHDQLLLNAYTHEDDIISTRDRKLSELDGQIRASEDTIKSLRGSLARHQTMAADEQKAGKPVSPQNAKAISNYEKQIANHETNVQKWHKDQEAMRAQYQADLERFRILKHQQVMPAANSAGTKK